MAGTTSVTIDEEVVPSSEGIGGNCALSTDEIHTSSSAFLVKVDHTFAFHRLLASRSWMLYILGLSIQSEDLIHPKVPTGSDQKTGRPDQVIGRRWVICSKNRLRRVGLDFPLQNP